MELERYLLKPPYTDWDKDCCLFDCHNKIEYLINIDTLEDVGINYLFDWKDHINEIIKLAWTAYFYNEEEGQKIAVPHFLLNPPYNTEYDKNYYLFDCANRIEYLISIDTLEEVKQKTEANYIDNWESHISELIELAWTLNFYN